MVELNTWKRNNAEETVTLPSLFNTILMTGFEFCAQVVLTCKLIGKRSLGRPRLRWQEIIRMDLKEMGVNRRNWVD